MADPVFDQDGLVAAVAQDHLTGQVRMVAWMSRRSLERTVETGFATFFSRSRQELWEKGATSGHRLRVRSIHADCDGDTLLLLVDPEGPSCHTGRPTCFFSRITDDGRSEEVAREPSAFLEELERELEAREKATADESYTRSLLDGGASRIAQKLAEEAGELAAAIADETDDRVAAEAADVVYHLLVGLRLRGISFRRVLEVLAARSGVSGHDEKRQRGR